MLSKTELLCQSAEAYMHEPQQVFFRDLLQRQRAGLQARLAAAQGIEARERQEQREKHTTHSRGHQHE